MPGAKLDSKKKATTTEFEVLNPKGVEAAKTTFERGSQSAEVEGDDELPQLTPSLEQFSRIPLRGYQQSWDFIKEHRDVVVPGAADALLVAAFEAQSRGDSKYAQQCVNQSLLLQYSEKLGRDGVTVFFRK